MAGQQERFSRLQTQLDAWDVMLEAAGHKQADQRWQERQNRLLILRQRFELLKSRREAPFLAKIQHSIQLPPLEMCNAEEHKLYEQYLDTQLKISQHLTDQLVKVNKWVLKASINSNDSWLSKLRLVKIRRFLSELEQERQRLDPHRLKQLQNWEKLTDRLLLYRDRHTEINETRQAFGKVVRLTNVIGFLQQKVHTLQGKTQHMEIWLKQAKKRLHSLPVASPPLVEDLRAAAVKIDAIGLEDLHRSKTRLALARSFIEKSSTRNPFLAPVKEEL